LFVRSRFNSLLIAQLNKDDRTQDKQKKEVYFYAFRTHGAAAPFVGANSFNCSLSVGSKDLPW